MRAENDLMQTTVPIETCPISTGCASGEWNPELRQ